MRITVDQAAAKLMSGDVVAVPTETVYGLAASINSEEGVAKVFHVKGRPSNNPLIIHMSDAGQIDGFKPKFDASFAKLAAAFWPGPLTLVLPIDTRTILESVRAGLSTAAFRIPKHPLALALLSKTGPLVMPSANLSGKPSSTTADHVESDFGLDFPVLDGGSCQCGVESTVMIYQDQKWVIIRQGVLVPQDFVNVLGYFPAIDSGKQEKPICPGQMYRHYAPKAKLKLATEFTQGVVLGFTGVEYPKECEVLYLGELSHPETIGENLYKTLRYLDEKGIHEAFVDMRFQEAGIMKTIAERLRKAAS